VGLLSHRIGGSTVWSRCHDSVHTIININNMPRKVKQRVWRSLEREER
jgi:hypothetical protein